MLLDGVSSVGCEIGGDGEVEFDRLQQMLSVSKHRSLVKILHGLAD